MQLEKQVSNLELSKKLKELGVKQESLYDWKYCRSIGVLDEDYEWVLNAGSCIFEDQFSAYTVAELGEMLPERGYVKDDTDEPKEDLASWVTFRTDGVWKCSLQWRYSRRNVEWFEADTEANARAKMLIYLVENDLLEANNV